MIQAILSDLSRTCLFLKDASYSGTLNSLYKELNEKGAPFNFYDYFILNEEYLMILSEFQDQFKLYMFTSGSIQNDNSLRPKLDSVFLDVIDPKIIGGEKDDSETYLKIAERLNFKPEEILFIDDDEKFLKAAKDAGLETHRFINNEDIKKKLNSII